MAEIELILSIGLLVTILMLVVGAMRLAVARLETNRTAGVEAFRTATADAVPMYTDDPDLAPVEGILAERGGLPNRTHVPRPQTEVTVYAGSKQSLKPVTVGARAGLAGPPWTFAAYPVGGQDATDTEGWFVDYAAESHTYVSDSLRLAPAWTP